MSMIYGKRVRLRALEKGDMAKFYDWVNDPEVTAGLTLFLPMSTLDEEKWFERVMQRPQEERPFAIEIRDGEGWRLVGNCSFFDLDRVALAGEVGIMIGDKLVWGQGYGAETMELLLRHGFWTLNLNRVSLRVYADNERAIRAYEKAGFVLEGRLRQAVYKQGKYHDVLMMSVLRNEWDARQEA